MKLLAGTSGYAFKEWKGSFYPKDCKPDAMLGLYSSTFPTVEINNTFYRLPKEDVLLGWAEQVPEPFPCDAFWCFPQEITASRV